MSRNFLAAVAGGIVLFIWGFLSWVVLPIHTHTMKNIPNEDRVIDVLRESIDAKGMYVIPGMPHAQGAPSPEAEKAWLEKYQRGPVGMIMYDPLGSSPMMPMQMVTGIVLNMLSALVVAWFLSRSTASASPYLARVAFCGMFGVFIMLASQLVAWNWFNEPNDWTAGLIIDSLIGWLLAGLAIGAFVKKSEGGTSAAV